MQIRYLYLLLAIVGTAIPYGHFWPWLKVHGMDVGAFRHDLHANGVSEFFAADVIISAIVLAVFTFRERRRTGPLWWTPLLATLTVGVSLGLPWLLYLRERSVTPNSGA